VIVFTLQVAWYDECVLLGVFSSYEAAERAIEGYRESGQYSGWHFDIQHFQLQD
jgi:hypothetical protein